MKIEIPGQGRYIGHFEKDTMSMMQMAECAKLIQAISSLREKKRDGRVDVTEAYYDLVAGIADVLVCLEQLQEIYNIPNHEIQYRVDKKIMSQEERMRELDRNIFEG